MDKYIHIIEANDCICDCEGPWGSLILLAPKPHQDSCNNINDFVWSLCTSYCPLNGVTKSFEFQIPRCVDSIENFGDFSERMCFISIDARSGNHQICVRRRDQENLAFFTASGKEKILKAMPFGPKNALAFYTTMMQFLCDDWTILFNETRNSINLSNSPTNNICNDRIIIDDIILFSNHIPTFLHYFSCVTQVFTKFRLSFKLSK